MGQLGLCLHLEVFSCLQCSSAFLPGWLFSVEPPCPSAPRPLPCPRPGSHGEGPGSQPSRALWAPECGSVPHPAPWRLPVQFSLIRLLCTSRIQLLVLLLQSSYLCPRERFPPPSVTTCRACEGSERGTLPVRHLSPDGSWPVFCVL